MPENTTPQAPAETPKRKGPPPPVPTDATAATLKEGSDNKADLSPAERLQGLRKVLSGMNLSGHESRWLRDSMLIMVNVLLEAAPGPKGKGKAKPEGDPG